MATQVGFIGLGRMGRPMAERLLKAGFGVHVYNRSQPAIDALVALGAVAAKSVREVAEKSEIVLTALPNPEQGELVFNQLAEAAKPGQLFIDHSTIAVDQSRGFAKLLAEKGAGFLDAPVSGGPGGANGGTLTVMVGGAQADFDRALPVFQAFGKNIKLCGPSGAGQVIKLINQLLVGVHTAAIAEAAAFGASLGADPKIVLEVIGTSFGGSTMMTRNVPRFISRDFSPATSLQLLIKDLGIIREEAKVSGAPLLLGALVEQRFLEGRARGFGEEDMAALVKLWEEPMGATVAKPKV